MLFFCLQTTNLETEVFLAFRHYRMLFQALFVQQEGIN